MKEFNFSIIIPHKDIPELLMRCLHSIPERDDVQVIVVDDNSKDADTYLEKYPELSRPNLEFYATKEGKGAGYARNVGLRYAKGEWLIFADADDFFTEHAGELMDKYVRSDSDIVYFDSRSVMSNDIQKETKWTTAVSTKRFQGVKTDSIRYTHLIPWAKMIRRSFVECKFIFFDEIPWCNDIFFSVQTGCLAKKIEISDAVFYTYTKRDGSLSDTYYENNYELKIRTRAALKSYQFALDSGYSDVSSICAHFLSTLFGKKKYLYFFRAIHMLDNETISKFFHRETRMLNRKGRVYFGVFILIGKYLPWSAL